MSEEEQKKIPIVMSPGFLMPMEEKNHYGLFRQVIVKREDGETPAGPPLGPLKVYRKCAKDETEDMWTFSSDTHERISLKLIFDARYGDVTEEKDGK